MNTTKKYEFTYLKSGLSMFVHIVVIGGGMLIFLAAFFFVRDLLGLSGVAEDVILVGGVIAMIFAMVATIYLLPHNFLNGKGFATFTDDGVEIKMENAKHIVYYSNIIEVTTEAHGRHGTAWAIKSTNRDKIRIPEPQDSFGRKKSDKPLKTFMAELQKRVKKYQRVNPQNIPKKKPQSALAKVGIAVAVIIAGATFLHTTVLAGNILHLRMTGQTVMGRVTNISSGRSPTITVRYEVRGQVFVERVWAESTFGIRAGDSIQLFHDPRDPANVTTGRPGMVILIIPASVIFGVGGLVFRKWKK